MKILHLIDSSGLYGAEQVLLTLMRGTKDRGDQPILGSLRLGNEEEKAIENQVARMGLELWKLPFSRGIDRAAMLALQDRCLREGVSIVHSHGYKANILNA